MKKSYHFFKVLLLSLISFQTVFAQENDDEKLVIAVLPFTQTKNIKSEDVEVMYGQVTEAFVNSKRFTVVERKNFSAVFGELEQQKNELYMNSKKLANQGQQLGANFLILGDIGASGSETVNITLKIIDVETGQITVTKNITSSDSKKTMGTLLTLGTAASALNRGYVNSNDVVANNAGQSLISNLSVNTLNVVKKTTEFINANFALSSKIIKIEKEEKGKATEVLISLGEGMALKKGDRLYVYELSIMDIGGKKIKRKTPIGKLKLKTIEGDVSVCEVSDGGEAILQKGTNKGIIVYSSALK